MKLCICQIIKDEHDYIEEWIEYHHNLGFGDFYLIEDFDSKSHKELLSKYNYVHIFQITDICNDEEFQMLNNRVFRQKIVYHIFERLWKNNYDWMAFIDPDEYIDCTKEQLYNVLNDNFDKLCISMCWKTMLSNNYLYHPYNHQKYSIFNTYTKYNEKFNQKYFNFKCIINCKHNLSTLNNFVLIPHFFKINYIGRYINFCNIYVKHFLFKSLEEYIKRLTNKGEQANALWNRKIDDWFEFNNIKCTSDIIKEFNLNNIKVKCNDFNCITYK